MALLSFVPAQSALAQSPSPTPLDDCIECYSPTPSPSPTPTPSASPSPSPTSTPSTNAPPAAVTGSGAGSINDLAGQRFNQMITNRVLGNVLLGVNEQVNCNDCVSAFGSAGSFSAGIHGRKNLTPNLSLLAGIAYAQYNEGGYRVTSSPIGAFALRYDFVDWGSSRRDEVAASIEVWQLWQRVKGYMDPTVAFNPFDASIATGTDRTNLVKIGGQWTHLFGSSVEANINGGWVQSFGSRSGIVASVTGDGTIVPTIGNQGWFEYGGRLGFRITKGWVADLFLNGTAGPQPVGNTLHGGVGLRISY
jgi:hypothetical protein